MALDRTRLSKPIDDRDPIFGPLLDDLQGNILKGHGRELTANLFVRFDARGAAAARSFLAGMAPDVTSARRQLDETRQMKNGGPLGGTVRLVVLAHEGYRALQIDPARAPAEPAFAAGMASRDLADGPAATWEAHLRSPHAMILVADDSVKKLDEAVARLTAELRTAGIVLLGIEMGRARFNEHGSGIEHFGYVDGRSQPLMLVSDLEAEEKRSDGGTSRWNPGFGPLGTVLAPDPGGTGPDSFGSFFVFRKLEQDVAGFKAAEKVLAKALGLDPASEEAELAGALVVGRFEDGTPVILAREAADTGAVPNDFTYADDPDGLRCPHQAHIRKTNPRGDVAQEHGLPETADRTPIMARRGIPYGVRSDDGTDPARMPREGVGLLFMAYQRSLVEQFEFTQKTWANNEDFLRPKTGLDPVIGQSTRPEKEHVPAIWRVKDEDPGTSFHFAHFVTMKGGEYFFAPSISFLKSLGAAATPAVAAAPADQTRTIGA